MSIYSRIYLEDRSKELIYVGSMYSDCVPEHGDLIMIDSDRYVVKRKMFRFTDSNRNADIDLVVSKNVSKIQRFVKQD